jgi:hypothetical protein
MCIIAFPPHQKKGERERSQALSSVLLSLIVVTIWVKLQGKCCGAERRTDFSADLCSSSHLTGATIKPISRAEPDTLDIPLSKVYITANIVNTL